ncbi:MAG: 1-(5-phosphoribosyl)-5-[(5-phosphoribosylamino)methylideneamino]imidazole-4-carboxamide isomerase [Saprospiraceae bacterium]|nr:1-(5-phosphoribosyl)-5-[(5-phosphoribosylamino)methylideneamino]imidazole-4-carboxamide isomerase [Saprospiraceae bacterium]
MKIIPAMDLMGGRCVRLQQGDFQRRTTYSADPLTVVRQFEQAGLQFLHLVDLDGAKTGEVVQWRLIEKIAAGTSLQIDFGGGVNSADTICRLFDCGVRQVTAGTIAVRAPDTVREWLDEFGPDRIVLGADTRDGKIAVAGWQEYHEMPLIGFIQSFVAMGVTSVISTDVSKDGLAQGPANALYQRIRQELPQVSLVASGGVRSLTDLHELKKLGVAGTIIGRALYDGQISLRQLRQLC